MSILLIIYFIFLFCYIIFNVYAILRVRSMRLEGDKTNTFLAIYSIVLVIIILISLITILGLNWSTNLNLPIN